MSQRYVLCIACNECYHLLFSFQILYTRVDSFFFFHPLFYSRRGEKGEERRKEGEEGGGEEEGEEGEEGGWQQNYNQ